MSDLSKLSEKVSHINDLYNDLVKNNFSLVMTEDGKINFERKLDNRTEVLTTFMKIQK